MPAQRLGCRESFRGCEDGPPLPPDRELLSPYGFRKLRIFGIFRRKTQRPECPDRSVPPQSFPAPAAAPAPAAVAAGDTPLTAPMPGKVSKIVAKAGDAVKKGDVVLMLEAMKMQNEIAAPVDGTVKSINVDVNENVKPGQIMAVIG